MERLYWWGRYQHVPSTGTIRQFSADFSNMHVKPGMASWCPLVTPGIFFFPAIPLSQFHAVCAWFVLRASRADLLSLQTLSAYGPCISVFPNGPSVSGRSGTLYAIHYTLYTVHYYVHYVLCTVHYILYTVYYSLYTMNYIL